jgi:hypothetical protein
MNSTRDLPEMSLDSAWDAHQAVVDWACACASRVKADKKAIGESLEGLTTGLQWIGAVDAGFAGGWRATAVADGWGNAMPS